MSRHTQSMLKDGSLDDKIIWVTGGGSGLGKAMVRYFVELGARVAISGRKEQKLIDDGIRIRQEQYEQTKKKSVNTKEYSSGYLEFDLHDDYSQHIGIVWENVGKMFCFSCNKEFKTETNGEK